MAAGVVTPERAAAALPPGTQLTVTSAGQGARFWASYPVADLQGRTVGVANLELCVLQYAGPINPPPSASPIAAPTMRYDPWSWP